MTDVVNEGFRQPPGDRERRAAASDELVSEEALRTARDSSIAVRFIDGSELSVESLSEVVLSDYLFDPQSAAATGIITLNSGLFHFNSNDVPDDGLVLKTPVATIGIRGTQFLVTVADEITIVDILEGQVEVSPLGGGKPITCEGGQSILVAGAKSDAVCGDLGSFTTAAAPPADQQGDGHDNSGRDRSASANAGSSGGGSLGGSPGGGDPGGGDPGGGDPGGGGGNHSGHGDGSNPGKGHGKGGGNNGGSNNPGGGKK